MPEAHAPNLRTDREHARPGTSALRTVEPRGGDHAAPTRRTVRVTGQAPAPRRRSSPTVSRVAGRPDRVARWAVTLGIFLAFMAAATARADVPRGTGTSSEQVLLAP
ncbi:MAG: hypothetical protein M3133_10805 [Actinomycetota bacterium]|nr:hypothetical protein [Actinomycetota bacterium]